MRSRKTELTRASFVVGHFGYLRLRVPNLGLHVRQTTTHHNTAEDVFVHHIAEFRQL
jgi:hypothetical protein